jgi:hypothetical protein
MDVKKYWPVAVALGTTLSLGALAASDNDRYELEPTKPVTVTNLDRKGYLRDDFYMNGNYMGVEVEPSVTFEQCDDDNPDRCDSETRSLRSLDQDFVGSLSIGDVVLIPVAED